jgi:hypothetical protein
MSQGNASGRGCDKQSLPGLIFWSCDVLSHLHPPSVNDLALRCPGFSLPLALPCVASTVFQHRRGVLYEGKIEMSTMIFLLTEKI